MNSTHTMVFISPRISATSHCITMVQRRYLTDVDRGRAIAWLQQRIAVREVARRLGVAPSVICRLQQRWQATGRVQDRPRSGRPRKTTRREDRYITRQVTMARTSTARRIRGQLRAATQTNVSVSNIKNRLHEVHLHARRPVKRPKLTRAHRRARLAWCRRHVRWTRAHWPRVMFTDESRFALEHPDGHTKVWRREGEWFLDECMLPVTAYGGGSIMVWAGFSAHHRTPLHHVQGNLNGQRYRDEILRPHAVPMLRRIGQGAVYQDDNAGPHLAGLVDDFLAWSGVVRMDWPACSPDLNPIEHFWDHLERQVRENRPLPATLPALLGLLQQEWLAIPQAVLRRYAMSVRRRCVDCMGSGGGYTHY